MKNNHISRITGAFFGVAVLASCGTLGDAASVSASGAADAGYVSEDFARAVENSSEAFDKALEEMTPEQEYYIGRAVGAQVLAKYGVEDSKPELIQYLNKILNTLAVNSPRPEIYNGYHAAVLDTDEINAFATSGGHIFITRGLINCADSEDALAAILAHEIAHIQLQHGIKAIKTNRFAQAIWYTGSQVTGALTEGTSLEDLTDIFDESITDIVSAMINNGYSRDQEFEADNMALTLLTSAGYDPRSLLDMERALVQNQKNHPGGFNATHPKPEDRVTNTSRRIGPPAAQDNRSFRRTRFAVAVR
jgi:predicted Zn-dependent protease